VKPGHSTSAFAPLFVASLIVAVSDLMVPFILVCFTALVNENAATFKILNYAAIAFMFGGTGVWASLTRTAYRNYGKRWWWFLVGAPFALWWLIAVIWYALFFALCLCGGPCPPD
jgi:hypothetical protein